MTAHKDDLINKLFEENRRLNSEVIELLLSKMQYLEDLNSMCKFYHLIIDEIAKCAPEAHAALLEHLRGVLARYQVH